MYYPLIPSWSTSYFLSSYLLHFGIYRNNGALHGLTGTFTQIGTRWGQEYIGDDVEMSLYCHFPYHTPGFFELSFLSSPTGPSATHRATREVSKRAAWHNADWALCPAGGMRFGVTEGGAIG